jgi:hypothetical protein
MHQGHPLLRMVGAPDAAETCFLVYPLIGRGCMLRSEGKTLTLLLTCREPRVSQSRRSSSTGTSSAASHGSGSKDGTKNVFADLLANYSNKTCCLCGFGADESAWKKGALMTVTSGK